MWKNLFNNWRGFSLNIASPWFWEPFLSASLLSMGIPAMTDYSPRHPSRKLIEAYFYCTEYNITSFTFL